MRFLPTSIHGVIDYLAGALWIAAPWLFGFAGNTLERNLLVGMGIFALLYSALTRYELGVFPLITMRGHLGLDFAAGLILLSLPWLFAFTGATLWTYTAFGLFAIFASFVTQRAPRHLREEGGR